MTQFNLTLDQIKEIYEAGIRRGNDEATAHEWGSRPSGSQFDELEEAMHDILNQGVVWGEPGYVDYDAVREMFKTG